MTTCGAAKTSTCGAAGVICNLEADHGGHHGVRERPGLRPYLTWTTHDQATVDPWQDDGRAWYRKPHKRREYSTLATWKARQP